MDGGAVAPSNGAQHKQEESDVGSSRDLDHIFEEIVGGNGWWQWRTTIILFPLAWIGGYPTFLSIFAAYTPEHRCFIQGCDSGESSDFNTSFVDFAIPKGILPQRYISIH